MGGRTHHATPRDIFNVTAATKARQSRKSRNRDSEPCCSKLTADPGHTPFVVLDGGPDY